MRPILIKQVTSHSQRSKNVDILTRLQIVAETTAEGHPYATIQHEYRRAADEIERLQSGVDFYKRRCDLLQQWQNKMRDPERTLVCDVLANGQTLPDPQGTRYPQEPTTKSNLFISDEDRALTREHIGRYG